MRRRARCEPDRHRQRGRRSPRDRNKLTALLKDHILTAADIVTAAKAGDNAKVASSNKKWHDNANEIATFLHGANPKHWPLATLQGAMNMHLEQTLDEATHQLKGDYAASVKDYDKVVEHILGMADDGSQRRAASSKEYG
jgi:hypothetical protein